MLAIAKDLTALQNDVTRTDLLRRALALGLELEGLLGRAGREEKAYRLRLARAHALSTIDALTELVREERSREPDPSKSGVFTIAHGEERRVGDLVDELR